MQQHPFENQVASLLSAHTPLAPGARIIVALSGGADSVALLAVLSALGYECVAAHCNFHLRGTESMRDQHHAEKITQTLGIDLYVKDFDVQAHVKDTGKSVEMACRDLRYEWFITLLEREHARAIAVGHHREDQVETFFINLLRGTGIAGLTGMAVYGNHIVRPMLAASRQDIEEYLNFRGITWVNDSTNAESEFRRNRLRNIVLPMLEQQFPGATNAIFSTMSQLADNQSVYDAAISQATKLYTNSSGQIDITKLKAENNPQQARTFLFEMLRKQNFNMTQASNILEAESGATFSSSTHSATLSHGTLTIADKASNTLSFQKAIAVSLAKDIIEPIQISVTYHHITEFHPARNPNVLYLDETVLHNNPVIELRHWRRGDRITPYGQTKSKLVSDIFADAHYTHAQKRDTWLLTHNGTILWIIGLRPSAHFTITPRTHRFLTLTF